jgi:hypothetical protein
MQKKEYRTSAVSVHLLLSEVDPVWPDHHAPRHDQAFWCSTSGHHYGDNCINNHHTMKYWACNNTYTWVNFTLDMQANNQMTIKTIHVEPKNQITVRHASRWTMVQWSRSVGPWRKNEIILHVHDHIKHRTIRSQPTTSNTYVPIPNMVIPIHRFTHIDKKPVRQKVKGLIQLAETRKTKKHGKERTKGITTEFVYVTSK